MWKESTLYQNLLKVYGEIEAKNECERILSTHGIKNMYEIKKGEIEKYYNVLMYFELDVNKYIDNLMEVIIEEDLADEIKNVKIIEKLENRIKYISNPSYCLEVAVYMIEKFNLKYVANNYFFLDNNLTLHILYHHYVPLGLYIPNCIKTLKVERRNHHTFTIPHGIENIIFEGYYDSPTIIPNSVKYLDFKNCDYNQEILLPNSVEKVIFGYGYSQRTVIPNSVTYLEFGACYDQKTTIPNSVKILKFGCGFNQEIKIPNSVVELKFGTKYDQETIIPNSVEKIEFGWNYNKKISIPNSVTHIEFGNMYDQKTIFPNSIKYIKFGHYYSQKTVIPDGVTDIIFGYHYNLSTIIPNTVINLVFGDNYNQQTIIPNSVVKLKFGERYRQVTTIPKSVNDLYFTYYTKINTRNNTDIFKFEE